MAEVTTVSSRARRALNDMSAKEWIKFTKSWFVLSGKADRDKTAAHPATFPYELPLAFIEFFTRKGEFVLDPFAGTGTTLVAADALGRRSLGFDLEQSFIDFAATRTESPILQGDASQLLSRSEEYPDECFDYVFTSPPYMNILRNSRGGNRDTRHKERSMRGETLVYGENSADLGNLEDLDCYLSRLVGILRKVHRVLKPRKYCTVILQNVNHDGRMVPVAWKFGLEMVRTGLWDMKGERIWCQENKRLGIYGYPTTYATNNFHHYCLTFRRVSSDD